MIATNASPIPSELRNLNNWVLYGSNKAPFQTNGDPAKSTDPQTWTDYDSAKQRAWIYEIYDGIGCVITPPFVGIDFDMACDPKTGKIEPWAQEWIKKFNSYTEMSPSGTGLHIWVKSDWSSDHVGKHKFGKKELGFGVEAYSHSRYFTVTEKPIPGFEAIREVSASLINELLAFAAKHEAAIQQAGRRYDESPSGEDNKLVRELAQELKTHDADVVEAELAKRYPKLYAERNAEKRDRTLRGRKVTYFRYTIERFFERNSNGNANGSGNIAAPVIDVPEETEEQLPEYPEPPRDLLSECSRAMASGTTMSLGHIRECLKVIAGSMIGDGNIVYPVYQDIRVLGYHFNLGDPQSTKSASFNLVRKQFEPFAENLNLQFKKLSGYGSKEFLVKGLSEQPHQLVFVTEGNELVTANENFPGVFSKITDAYDERVLTTGSFKNKDFEAKDVELASVICQTRDDFTRTFGGRSAIGGGGLARWTITFSPRLKRIDWIQDLEQIAGMCNLVRARVQDIRACKVVVRESPEAKRIRLATFEDFDQLDNTFSARLDDIYRREILLAAAFAPSVKGGIPAGAPEFMDNLPTLEAEVTAEMAAFARKLTLEHQYLLRQALWPNDAGSNVERMEIAIRRRLETHCHQSDRNLMATANVYRPGSGGTEIYKRAKKALAGQGMKCTGVNRKGHALYCSIDCRHPDTGWRWQ